MFISHDISTVRAVCDEILVLYAGQKVEHGSRDNFSAPPFHPYTDLLIGSVPEMRRGWLEQAGVQRMLPAVAAPSGERGLCPFLDRCPVRIDEVCNRVAPPRVILQDGNEVLCHHSDAELQQYQQRIAEQPEEVSLLTRAL
ncbi:MAG: hypothetical protein P8Y45_09995 [Exilibacterium sp.]